MFKIYNHNKLRIVNNTKASTPLIINIIDMFIPKKIKNYPINILIIYRHNYRKTLKKINMEKQFNLQSAYPFRGVAIHTIHENKYKPTIIITISKQYYTLKIKGDKKMGYLPMMLHGNIEDFVVVVSHELYHCLQGKENRKYDETEADRYALSCLKRWRNRR